MGLALAAPLTARANGEPVSPGATVGYELTLAGATRGERGYALTLTGVGYEVDGLAALRAQSGLELDAQITEREERGTARRVVARASTRTGSGGQFTLAVELPDRALSAPQLELELHRAGQPGRRFVFGLSPERDLGMDLLTDRERYQPGERVRAWARVRGIRTGAPLAGRRVRLTLYDRSSQPLAEHVAETGPSGVVTAELTLPDTAEAGHHRVRAEVLGPEGGPEANRAIQVWRRTVERLLAEVVIDRADEDGVALVRPGGPLAGRVRVTTPSGTPVRGATVEVRVREGAAPVTLTTDAEGNAQFDLRAPSYLAGDVGSQVLDARAVHAAYGTITASARYLVARVPSVVGATARGGAIVPEVDATVYVSVSDPRGRPLIRGTEVVVRGAGLPPDGRRGVLDELGFAEVVVRLPRGAASRMQGGACSGRVAATFEVEVRLDPPRFSRVCVPVTADAEVAVEVTSAPLAAPGTSAAVRVARRPSARGRPVLVEALYGGRAVAFAWIEGGRDTGELALPRDLLGVIELRARALRGANDREPGTEPGATAFGVGSFDAVLVRPADAFSLSVAPERPRYLVQERASVALTASANDARGWAALLVRDEAAHGGEGAWDLFWMRGALHRAVTRPQSEANTRFVRASLAGSLGIDPEPMRPPELEPPYWRGSRHHQPYREDLQAGRGVLRDPTAQREELLRRGLGRYELLLEQVVAQLGPAARDRAPIVQGRGFHPQVLEHLMASGRLDRRTSRTLGGQPITVAMIEAADPGFSFDVVGRRVARQRLSKLLVALLNLTDPDNSNAQRASANLPPERWLGTLVQLGMVQAHDLTDPWGNAYVFRRVTGRRPRVAVSDRALDWELASPGPDGRLNTADDVADPFARAVPAGTPYAVVSGEESLMRQLAALAPSGTVLTRMGQAYQRLALAAQEEQVAGPISASGSEDSDEEVSFAETESLSRGDRVQAEAGGAGFAMPAGAPAPARARLATPEAVAMAPAEPAADDAPSDGRFQVAQESRAEALGTLVREDFPATLFFVGEVPLEGGRAAIEVPLADALTTYRLEAIAWTASGWTTSGEARLRVDQRALVDAPVPEHATAGDRVRLPVRVENRTDEPLPLRLVVEAEGGLALAPVAPIELTLPARGATESIVELALTQPGEGRVVVSIESAGRGIDAVRRPMRVLADARTARDRRVALVDGGASVVIDVPREASERGPGQVRVTTGARMFGDLDGSDGSLWAAWALVMAGEPLPDALAERVHEWLTYEDHGQEYLREPRESSLALGASWREARLGDRDAARALRAVGQNLPARERLRQLDPSALGDEASWLLLALAPVAQDLDRRPALREDASRLLARLREIAAIHATGQSDAPVAWSRAAAALALSGGMQPRAEELVRRTERHLVRVGDAAWVEPEAYFGGREPRAQPTALLALAQIALGRRAPALELVRALAEMHLSGAVAPPPWIVEGDIVPPPCFFGLDRYLAAAAAARLTTAAGASADPVVRLDGARVETVREGGVTIARLAGVGAPGRHELRVELPEGAVALAHFAVAYLVPWDVTPRRDARIEVALDGERGARDTRAGLRLRVQNRGARLLTQPVVEIELPAGSELDEPTRERLASLLRADAHMEGRTLILPLRALSPGGWVVLPLPVRWALSGSLRGLGVVAYDALGPDRADVLPISIRRSEAVELADEGPEPEPPDAEASEPERPIRPPLPRLAPLAAGGL
ncbi:MAG: hypothetical protein KF729_13450 [Sandaracinaceae bacterium]|nr:hypothetical protein [Sandaracinaceae bacterium]